MLWRRWYIEDFSLTTIKMKLMILGHQAPILFKHHIGVKLTASIRRAAWIWGIAWLLLPHVSNKHHITAQIKAMQLSSWKWAVQRISYSCREQWMWAKGGWVAVPLNRDIWHFCPDRGNQISHTFTVGVWKAWMKLIYHGHKCTECMVQTHSACSRSYSHACSFFDFNQVHIRPLIYYLCSRKQSSRRHYEVMCVLRAIIAPYNIQNTGHVSVYLIICLW